VQQVSIATFYQQQFNTRPALLVQAPGRINLIGEHTDYNAGFVLPGAIQQSIWLAIGPREDTQLHCYAMDWKEFIQLDAEALSFQKETSWANYLLGVLEEFRLLGSPAKGLNIAFGGNIPTGAGLSSSAALVSAMAVALNELFEQGKSRLELAQLAQRAENNFVGTQCGIMDMFASLFGKAGQVLQLDCRDLSVRYFTVPQGPYSWVLLDSGVKHRLVESEYNTRRAECEAGVAYLQEDGLQITSLREVTREALMNRSSLLPETVFRRCLFVVEEIERVQRACQLLEEGQLVEFGRLLTECHRGLDSLYEVCVPETNFLVEQAICRAGVLGARQMGGGFGGCVLCLVETELLPELIQSLSSVYHSTFGIQLLHYPVQLSEGAQILKD